MAKRIRVPYLFLFQRDPSKLQGELEKKYSNVVMYLCGYNVGFFNSYDEYEFGSYMSDETIEKVIDIYRKRGYKVENIPKKIEL